MNEISQKHCVPCEGGTPALKNEEIKKLMSKLDGWNVNDDNKEIFRTFHFKNYYHTMAFLNAIAWMAHRENHHPDIEVGYNYCKVRYSTHAIGGLSENDFICASKVDKLNQNK